MKRFLTTILLILLPSFAVSGQEILFQEEFWCRLDPVLQDAGIPLTYDEAASYILEEARYVFSGMIYGYSFLYTPRDNTRKIDELFQITPIAEIPWGDPGLKISQGRTEGEKFFAFIRYYLNQYQESRRTRWLSNTIPSAGARGTGDIFSGRGEKITAIEDAIREAIRSRLRMSVLNKPREISGEVLLLEAPYIIIDSGKYVATVRIKLKVNEVIPYRQF